MQSEVGRILDKYELLERIGSGGMAVVYRGLDRTLGREVAVKILHDHLADSGEARERFEREARAVAKLRHDNIVEIFDFSGNDSEQSYIVTELITGRTLKDIIAERDVRHPEIGAMITVQVCRALGHAHSLGILHRDVKPENIMIRQDGVVKLMDFGIAQMVDLSRMTVTGQLLGSPAYMSPEHVEGRPLDFRTDVFSVGILLYQLVCGELPFTGKNPHEVLKRIAECNYADPRKQTPLCGNELGSIIGRALAREKDDRYADVSLMVEDLERYLACAGLTNPGEELARYFAAPVAYEMALRPRLTAALTQAGRDALGESRARALDLWNRVLALDPDHEEVLTELARLSRRRRGTQLAGAALGVLLLIGLLAGARAVWLDSRQPDRRPALVTGNLVVDAMAIARSESDTGPEIEPTGEADSDPGHPSEGAKLGSDSDSNPDRVAVTDNGSAAAAARGAGEKGTRDRDRARARSRAWPEKPAPRGDAGAPVAPAKRTVTLRIYPPNSEYRIDSGPWTRLGDGRASIALRPRAFTITARNPACCVERSRTISPSFTGAEIDIALDYLPARIVPRCDVPGVRVQVGGRPARLGRATPIFFNTTLGSRIVEVVFFKTDSSDIDEQRIRVTYDQTKAVTCDL